MIEIVKDLGIINGKRRGVYSCHCGNQYETRTDTFKFNERHGKPNGCSRKCKKNQPCTEYTTTNPNVQVTPKDIYVKDVEEGSWDSTMFGKDFKRFFNMDVERGSTTTASSKEDLKKKLKENWLLINTDDKLCHIPWHIKEVIIET